MIYNMLDPTSDGKRVIYHMDSAIIVSSDIKKEIIKALQRTHGYAVNIRALDDNNGDFSMDYFGDHVSIPVLKTLHVYIPELVLLELVYTRSLYLHNIQMICFFPSDVVTLTSDIIPDIIKRSTEIVPYTVLMAVLCKPIAPDAPDAPDTGDTPDAPETQKATIVLELAAETAYPMVSNEFNGHCYVLQLESRQKPQDTYFVVSPD